MTQLYIVSKELTLNIHIDEQKMDGETYTMLTLVRR